MSLTDEIANDASELAERFRVPGLSIGVDLAGEVMSVNQGVTSVDHPLPVDGDTLFQIASMSKPFAATLVMMLVESGQISLEDPVIDHVPDFTTRHGEHDRHVTVRHLLTHTTGWDGDHLLVHPIANGQLADAPPAMSEARQLVPPGSHWTYNNAGYAIAGRLIENVTRETYAKVLRDSILAPLGMAHTATNADEAIVHRVAMRHTVRDRVAVPLTDSGWQTGWALEAIDLPVGGMISTTNDLLAWLRCWLDRDTEDALSLSSATRTTMRSPQTAWYNPTTSQGIGWAVRKHPGGTVHGHGGLTAGYCSYSMFCPELDLAAAILTNSTTGTALCNAIAQRLISHVSGLESHRPTHLSPQPDLQPLAGCYTGSFGEITVTIGEDGLELSTKRHPISTGEWQPDDEPARTATMYAPDHAVVTSPPSHEGTLIDFARSGDDKAAWIRSGGRIHTRVSG